MCVGASHILYLYQGARFRLTYLDQEAELSWVGVGAQVEFTIPTPGADGQMAAEDDPDDRELFLGVVGVDILEGVGGRASNVRAVAKRAGIPETGHEIPFALRLKNEVRPNRPVLKLRERTPYDFTVTWRTPMMIEFVVADSNAKPGE